MLTRLWRYSEDKNNPPGCASMRGVGGLVISIYVILFFSAYVQQRSYHEQLKFVRLLQL
jgi:hypothetical protein